MTFRYFLTFLISVYFVAASTISTAIADDKEEGTLLTLSVTEAQEIEEDLLIAYMQYEHEGPVAREVQNAINNRMKQAMEMAKKIPALTELHLYLIYSNKEVLIIHFDTLK